MRLLTTYHTNYPYFAAMWVALSFAANLWCSEPTAQQFEFFEKKIRPVLVENCLECHSTDTEASGGLLLDSRAGVLRGGDSGPAVKLGDPSASKLVRAIEYQDLKLRMPPDGKLPQSAIDSLREWIATGAADPRQSAHAEAEPKKSTALPVEKAQQHWAYRPPVRSEPPLAKFDQIASSTIDAFVAAKLGEAGLEPAGPAERNAILRRLTYDLHGLPPSPEEIDEFDGDCSPDAYARLVDRLLASTRFAERWARHWMDVVRYGESVTLRGFIFKDAWRYRDYLIQSFRDDRPFDLLLREQIAGDLMSSDDPSQRELQLTASTFLQLGNSVLEEQDKKQLEMDFIDEQLDVICRAYLAQTVTCARCHDHKFDPIPTRDYYALAGILKGSKSLEHANISKWVEKPLPLPAPQEQHFASIQKQLTDVTKRLDEMKKQLKSPEGDAKTSAFEGVVIDDGDAKKIGQWRTSSALKTHVGSGYLTDDNAGRGTKTVTYEPKALTPGNYEVRMSYCGSASRSSRTSVRVFSADGEAHVLVDQTIEPTIDNLWYSLGKYRFEPNGQAFVIISNEGADGFVIADAVQFLPTELAKTADAPTAEETAKPDLEADEQKKLKKQIAETEKRKKALESDLAMRPVAMTVDEQLPARDIAIHVRGSVHTLGEVVPRGFLQAVYGSQSLKLESGSSGRREMAQWLTSQSNPLTARVYVNRAWYWLIGEGLVDSLDNFGTTGQSPSHPLLLDWLAIRFVENGWSTKRLVREIVMSDAYRRAVVEPSKKTLNIDPDNRLLWRANRRRLDAESMRDAMLAISAEIQFLTGGSTIKPEAKDDYEYQHPPTLRAIYLPLFRNSLPELFDAFDFPNPSMPIGRRSRSTVAPQALLLLNNSWVNDRAVQAARRVRAESNDCDANRISIAYRLCLGRNPTVAELSQCEQFLRSTDAQAGEAARSLALEQLLQSLFASIDFRFLD